MPPKSLGDGRRPQCIPGPGVLLVYAGNSWRLWSEKKAAVEISHKDKKENYTAARWVLKEEGFQLQGEVNDSDSADPDKAALGGLFVLGCRSGGLQVWSSRSGELAGPVATAFQKLGKSVVCAVTALAPAQPHRRSVFAGCSGSPDILEVGLLDGQTRATIRGDKVSISHLACTSTAAEWLVSAGSSSTLKVWRIVEDGTASSCGRFTGPAGVPTCVDAVSEADGSLLALSCDGTAQADIFTLSGSKAPGDSDRPITASYILSCRHHVQFATFVPKSSLRHGARAKTGVTKQDGLLVVGFGEGGLAVWSFKPESGLKEAKTIQPILSIASQTLGPGSKVRCARLTAPQPDAADAEFSVFACSGYLLNPLFFHMYLQGSGAEAKAAIRPLSAIRAAEGVDDSKPAAAAKAAAAAVRPAQELGPLETSVARHRAQKRVADEASAEARKVQRVAVDESLTPAGSARSATGALSISAMVRQGLRAQDKSAVEAALKVSKKDIIDATCAELTASEAWELLHQCTSRLISQPLEANRLATWIQSLLVRHLVKFATWPLFRKSLEPLHDTLVMRTSSLRLLMRARGCLRSRTMMGMRASKAEILDTVEVRTPLVDYTEGDDDTDEEASQIEYVCGSESSVGGDKKEANDSDEDENDLLDFLTDGDD